MVLFNYSTKEITAKVVYYGPGLCGKTTNLQFIFDNMPKNIQRGRMLSLATKTDRTLFFDFLPLDLGNIRDMKTRVQLYTVPGQVFYNSTRKLVLKGADGIVFVADSQTTTREANLESFANLEDNCAENGINLSETPLILQFNKRDLPDIMSLDELNDLLNKYNAPFFESVATTGIGVHEALKGITKLVIRSLQQRHDVKSDAEVQSEQAVEAVSSQVVSANAVVPSAVEPMAPVASMAPALTETPPLETVAPQVQPIAVNLAPEAEASSSVPSGAEQSSNEVQPSAAPKAEVAVVEGLLRLADSGEPVAEEGMVDLAAELTAEPEAFKPSSGVTESPAEGVIPPEVSLAGSPSTTALPDDDPLGLGSGAMAASHDLPQQVTQKAVPVVLQPGQEEIHIPLEIRAGDQVHRYRLRLHISLGRED